VASACGGSGIDESPNDVGAGGVPDALVETETVSETDAGGGVSATVTIGSQIYEFDGDVACLTGGAVSVTFANGSDQITINHSNDVILIRMTIDGEQWVDAGSPPAPGVAGDGEDAIVTWSGPMSSNGASETVSIEVRC